MMPPALATLSRSNRSLAIHAFASNGDYYLLRVSFQGFTSRLQARLVVVSGVVVARLPAPAPGRAPVAAPSPVLSAAVWARAVG